MSALLRILSKLIDGTIESRIIPIKSVLEFRITVKEDNAFSAEELVKDDTAEEVPETVGFNSTTPGPQYTENRLIITKTDGTEEEVNAIDGEHLFEIRDHEGEIIVETNNLFKLEEGFLISHIESSNIREKKIREQKK